MKLQSVEPLHNRGYSIFNQQAGQIKLFGSEHEGFTPNSHSSIGKMMISMISNEDLACQFRCRGQNIWVISSQKKGFRIRGSRPLFWLHTPADAMEGLSSRHQRHSRGFAEDHQPGATRRTPILERLFYLMTPRGWFQTIGSMGTQDLVSVHFSVIKNHT